MNEDSSSVFLLFLFGLALVIGLFLLLREVTLWYFKINKMVEQNEKTNRLLQEIVEKLPERYEESIKID